MKTDLPERAEYYRPTRARELRDEAAWLAQFRVVIALAIGSVVLLLGLGLFGLGAGGFLLLSLPLVVGKPWDSLSQRAARLRAEAEALEAEHAARYGSPPNEVP
jgi:hypothetical protein